MSIIFPISKKFYLNAGKKIFKNKKKLSFFFIHDKNKTKFKNKKIFETKKFYNRQFFEKIKVPAKFKKNTISKKDYLEYEFFFFKVYDRTSFFYQSKIYKRDLFLSNIYFFTNFLKEHKIKKVFFTSSPHMGWDIPFYYTCIKLNIKTIISHLTDLPNISILRKNWKNNKFIKLDRKIYIDKIIGENLSDLSLWTNKIRTRFKKTNLIKDHYQFFKFIIYLLTRKNYEIDDSCFYYDQEITKSQKILYYLQFYFHTMKLKINYFKYSKKINLNNKMKYVYFALHYQPERTTVPESQFFGNQLVVLHKLRELIPKEIAIIVKEHPVQHLLWHPRPSQIKCRENNFYKKINNIQNVQIADIKQDSTELIKNSLLCSTMTGSTGWEALKNNKPVIVFGCPWYSSHKFCHIYSKNKFDNKKTVSAFLKLHQNFENENKKFLRDMKNYFYKTWLADHVTKQKHLKEITDDTVKIFKKVLN